MSDKLHFVVTILGMAALAWMGAHGQDTQWALVALVTGHGAKEILK